MSPDGLESMFQEIKDKNSIEDLSPAYRKVCEWLRIE